MKIYPEQLEQNLKSLKSVYIVAGDEPLQKIETADKIRKFVKAQGILEREILDESSKNPLTEQAGTLSLFAETRLLEWRFEKSIKKGHGEAIAEFIESQAPDILLIVAPKLASEKRTAWFKAVEKQALLIEVWPIAAERLHGWLRTRAKSLNVQLDNDALNSLAQRCEGNLLAAQQDLQMLSLLSNGQAVTSEQITDFIGDSARYSMFELGDACLAGQVDRALRMLASLQSEGIYPLPIVNTLLRECQQLADLAEQVKAGNSLSQVMQSARIWPKKQKIIQAALQKGSVKKWYALVQMLTFIDKSAKGQGDADVWTELAQVISLIGGVNPLRQKSKPSSPEKKVSAAQSAQSMADLKKSLGMA